MKNILNIQTEILESLDWNEEYLIEAVEYTCQIFQDLHESGFSHIQAADKVRKVLEESYTPLQSKLLVELVVSYSIKALNTAEA